MEQLFSNITYWLPFFSTKANGLKFLNTEMKALRVVWLVSFAFILAVGPYAAVNVCFLINERLKIPETIIIVSSYLNYTNSMINPILYTFFNKQFRDSFWHILTCRRKKVWLEFVLKIIDGCYNLIQIPTTLKWTYNYVTIISMQLIDFFMHEWL